MDAQAVAIANLKSAARARGMTMQRLADAAAVSGGYLSEILAGKKSPTIRTLMRLSAALDLEVIDLFRRDLPDRLAAKPAERPRWRTPATLEPRANPAPQNAPTTNKDA